MCRIVLDNKKFHYIILVLLSIVVIFYNLGQNSFHDGDEASHALIVKEILETGDWMKLKIDGEDVFFKPPLIVWLSAISCRIFGFSEFSIRFPSALFGLLTILFTYFFAERLFDRRTALLSSLLVFSCTQFIYVHSTRTGEFDTAITFIVLLTAYFIWKSNEKKIYFYLAFACIGITAMIKSIIFVVPLGIVISANSIMCSKVFLNGIIPSSSNPVMLTSPPQCSGVPIS